MQLKIKQLSKKPDTKDNKTSNTSQSTQSKNLIQIIDISSKILYGEVKAEQQFLTLINAAVSHELRNPLNSLIGQKESMQSFLKNLKRAHGQLSAAFDK